MATDIPKDRLEIKVLEARDLRAPQGSGVNPFAIVECADDFENTDTKTGNPNPVWGDKIMVFDNITAQEVEFLLVTLKHKDLLAYQDKDLGVVPVALATALQSPGITLVDWYPLRKTTGMGDEEAHGEVRLSVTYFLDDAADLEDSEEYDSEEDLSKTVPNALKVTVEGGRSLRNPGGSGPCDAYVILQCGKTQKRCKPVRKNNHPKWGFEAVFFNKDPDQYLYITVRQKTAISSKMIGQARVSMVEMAGAKFQNWVQLVDAKWRFNAEGLGEVQLTAEWVYDKKVKAKFGLGLGSRREKRRQRQEAKRLEDQLAEILHDEEHASAVRAATNSGSEEETEMFMDEEERQAFEEAAEAAEREAMAAQVELEEKLDRVKAGDYQMQVHVIEGRDLKGENFNGTSDPIVTVECFGQKRHTRVVKNVTNCLFGDVLYFNFKDLTIEQVQGGAITVACHDAERIRFNQLIGTYSFDFLGVYLSENHEIYRQWIGVIDNKSKKDKGPQGWIKLSITLLGPGDRQKVHNIEEEIDKELKDDFEAGQIGGMVLSGPTMKQELNFLVVTIFRGEDLPNYSSMGTPSIKAYVRVDFAANPKTARTRAVSVKSREGLCPTWGQELHLPVYVPTNVSRIALSVWHKELTGDKLVGMLYYDFTKVTSAEESKKKHGLLRRKKAEYIGQPPKWGLLYGAPQGSGQSKETAKLMNKYPDLGSHYRGRLLVGMYVNKRPTSGMSNQVLKKKVKYELTEDIVPKTAKYTLRATVVQGSEVPVFKFPNRDGAVPMKVLVTMGRHTLETDFRPNRKGMVEWNKEMEIRQIDLPRDPQQMPDVILYLLKGPEMSSKPVSFCRIKAVDLLKQKFREGPKWFPLVSDPTKFGRFGLNEDSYPGSLLVRLGFGWEEHAREHMWESYEAFFEGKAPYGLRVNIFQARGLPSADPNGLLDPYVKVRFCGSKKKTKVKKATADPHFYQMLEFAEMLPYDPESGKQLKELMPEVILQVWDRDVVGKNTQVAGMRLAMPECYFTRSATSKAPAPKWYPLQDTNGEAGDFGELLVSVQLIAKRTVKERFPTPAPLVPACRTCFLEVIALGCRDLEPLGFTGLGPTFLEFELTSDGERLARATRHSKDPNSKNPNYSNRFTMMAKLPDEYLFCPQLTIRCFEKKIGARKKLVGVATIDIISKLPWNDTGYVQPQQEAYRVNENIDDTQAEEEEKGSDDEDGMDSSKGSEGSKGKKKKKDGGAGEKKGGDGGSDEEGGTDEEGGSDEDSEAAAPDVGFGDNDDAGTGILPTEESVHPTALPEVGPGIEDRMRSDIIAEDGDLEAGGDGKQKKGWWGRFEDAYIPDLAEDAQGPVLNELDIAFPKGWASSDYVVGRQWWAEMHNGGNELEHFMQTKPFENYPLYRGSSRTERGMFTDKAPTKRKVGMFKGLIVVTEAPPKRDNSNFIDMEDLIVSRQYVLRLYVVNAMHLQPHDRNGLSDPYLKIQVGKTKINAKKETRQKKELNPEFYHFREIPIRIPGDSQLAIQVWDWDRFTKDTLIGETLIDLEDRWFSRKWQMLGTLRWLQENEKLFGDRADAVRKRVDELGPLKPLEVRDLWVPTCSNPQGQLRLWLEIVPDVVAREVEPEELLPPERVPFEVRVIVWNCKNVVSMDSMSGLNDLYVKCWLSGNPKKVTKTDTHFRAKSGRGSFNYRMKFTVDLPLKNPEGGRLLIQMWDRDLLKWNDFIAESSIELYKWLQLAYQRRESVKPFLELKESIERFEAKKKKEALGIPVEEKKEEEKKSEEDNPMAGMTEEELAEMEGSDEEGDEDSEGGEDDLEKPLLGPGGAAEEEEEDPDEVEARRVAAAEARAEELAKHDDTANAINAIKNLTGFGDLKEDAEWVKMTKTHHSKGGKLEPMGECAFSVEILPKEMADADPVGKGRSEPNHSPFLPPPTGRLQFSINPFRMAYELLGPALCIKIAGTLICVIAFVGIAMLGQYYTTFATMF